ncbi:hypothetical protein N4T20_18675 [Flavobacterium sp. TR2]|uniref:hypothetical protein n=1 Tax=Flavobacterium sp. TR2 TaxID=2977321 RepID=UPI0021B099A6|nr:hypothetical protein [Flavobacterium sp. TR2]UWY27737.1 hypothetical protein N4T20_18675 [Flavobacterium sp. TR2]
MFEVYVSKQNNDHLKRFIIPRNKGYNISTWILITIKGNKEFLMERFFEELEIIEEEWELKSNYAFPSALMNEFLRLDFDDENLKSYL